MPEGEVVARKVVSAGRTGATVRGLASGRAWVQVRPLRTRGGKACAGVHRGRWAEVR